MSFFKAYDMRGAFGADFDLALVRKIGRALPSVVPGTRWLVGRDARVTSPAVAAALVHGLSAAGATVDYLGECTTPMVYFFTGRDGYDGSVMVTASHNPPGDNGLKVSRREALPVGYADGLGEVERLVAGMPDVPADDPAPVPVAADRHRADYLDWMRVHSPEAASLRYAVDCSNGMSSLLAAELFPGAEILNAAIDGTFPAHAPNPLKAEAREQLAARVREKGLDCGVIFDGDADRAMFVDETGAFVQPDYLIPLVARASTRYSSANGRGSGIVIHDVRTSRGAIETLREDGFEPRMVPVGHAFAKPALRNFRALCGGELAGHYYFSDFRCCDSGVLAARRILGEIAVAKDRGLSFSALMRPIVSRYANSGELNFTVTDKDAAVARVLAAAVAHLPPETGRETMDGVRLAFADGWINIRKSNTEPYLRLIAEARTPALLADWVATLTHAIRSSE